jgi:hypothetical protein
MKTLTNTLFLSLLLSCLAFGATVGKPALVHLNETGSAYPTQRESFDSAVGGGASKPYLIHIDTSEIDTGLQLFHVLGSPVLTATDTIGVFSFTCKDSTGSDTVNVVAKWQGNPRCDGAGKWDNIDSVTYVGATSATANVPIPASSSYANKSKVVVNTGGYCAYRFYLRNPMTTAARKATCKDAVLIHRRRGIAR